MSQSGTSTMTAQRIERLLRSLVGVSDLRLQWTRDSLGAVHILRDARVQPHQLIRNVVSGLQAGIGIVILPTQVHVHENARALEAVGVALESANGNAASDAGAPPAATPVAGSNGVAPDVHAAVQTPAKAHGTANGVARNGNGHAVATPRRAVDAVEPVTSGARAGTSATSQRAAELMRERRDKSDIDAGLQLERIDIERRGAMLRCRTVLALNGRTYSAIAEVPDAPAAEAELAARVAVDALRAGGLTEATLDGVGFITISDVNYCVTTVRAPGATAPRAGAAPMIDSMAASATAAVLTALGTYTDARPHARARISNSTNANL